MNEYYFQYVYSYLNKQNSILKKTYYPKTIKNIIFQNSYSLLSYFQKLKPFVFSIYIIH